MTKVGKKVLVTAERGIGRELSSKLRARGLTPLELPCITIEPADDLEAIRREVSRLSRSDWLVVTSRNGARTLRAIAESSLWERLGDAPQIATVGPSTAETLEAAELHVDLVPEEATSKSLLAALLERDVRGRRVLLLLGNLAKDTLARGLEGAGARVRRVTAYRTVAGVEDVTRARALAEHPSNLDVVAILSGSAAEALASALGPELFVALRFACIGPSSAATVSELGGRPAGIASPHTLDGLVHAIVDLCDQQ